MKILKYILGLTLLYAITSCKEKLGNYDYHDINEITIEGVDKSYAILQSIDTLRIKPVYNMTELNVDSSRFSYFWVIKQNNQFLDTLGREKNLNYPVTLAPNNYVLQLRVIDRQTDVTFIKQTNLSVGTPYSRGWLLVGENENDNAEFDIISMVRDTFPVRNLLAKSGLPTLKGSLLAQHTGGNFESNYKLWISSNTGAYYLDRVTMKGKVANTFGSLVYTTDPINKNELSPAVIAPQLANSSGGSGGSSSRAVLTSNGHLFAISLFGAADLYGNPANRHASNFNKLLKAAPYALYSIGSFNSVVWYDVDNNRFMNLPSIGFAATSDYPQDLPDDPFPWNQAGTGRKLRYAENTRNTDGGSQHGNSFAVMINDNRESFIYKFYANGGTPAKRASYKVTAIATDFDKADYYAFSSNRTVVFYAVGAKLYAYDYNPGNEKIYQFPEVGTDPITMLKFDTTVDAATNALYIATYNANTKGTLRRFNIGNNPNQVDIQAITRSKWDGLLKIKTMNWRAVN